MYLRNSCRPETGVWWQVGGAPGGDWGWLNPAFLGSVCHAGGLFYLLQAVRVERDYIVVQDGRNLHKQSRDHYWVTWLQGWPLHDGDLFWGLYLEAELEFQRLKKQPGFCGKGYPTVQRCATSLYIKA